MASFMNLGVLSNEDQSCLSHNALYFGDHWYTVTQSSIDATGIHDTAFRDGSLNLYWASSQGSHCYLVDLPNAVDPVCFEVITNGTEFSFSQRTISRQTDPLAIALGDG